MPICMYIHGMTRFFYVYAWRVVVYCGSTKREPQFLLNIQQRGLRHCLSLAEGNARALVSGMSDETLIPALFLYGLYYSDNVKVRIGNLRKALVL